MSIQHTAIALRNIDICRSSQPYRVVYRSCPSFRQARFIPSRQERQQTFTSLHLTPLRFIVTDQGTSIYRQYTEASNDSQARSLWTSSYAHQQDAPRDVADCQHISKSNVDGYLNRRSSIRTMESDRYQLDGMAIT